MRFAIFSFLVILLAALAMAGAPQKRVIISYKKDTPDSVLDQAKDAIKRAGGQIIHEYNIIKAFACTAPASVLESVQALSNQYTATIEEDSTVSINNDL